MSKDTLIQCASRKASATYQINLIQTELDWIKATNKVYKLTANLLFVINEATHINAGLKATQLSMRRKTFGKHGHALDKHSKVAANNTNTT